MNAIATGALVALLGISCTLADSATPDPLAPQGNAPSRPAPAPVKPVTETLWGKQVTDNYRYMEALDAATVEWMQAQSAYTRTVLDAIESRAALEVKIAAFTGSFGFTQGYASYGGRAFYEERTPGSDNFDLVVMDQAGKRKIVDVAALRAAHGGTPVAINFFLASPDGSKVAAGISQGGSEAASIFVYDAATGKQIAGPLDRADPGELAWSGDSSRLYVPRLKQLAPGEAEEEKYNLTLFSWDLESEPTAVLGHTAGRGPPIQTGELPKLSLSPGSPTAVAVSINGMQTELALWLAPVSEVDDPNVEWVPFADREDGVTAVYAAGDTIYLLSQKNAPTFQVLSVKAGQPFATARVVVPAEKDRVIDSMHAASDALYLLARQGVYSQLLRVPYASGKAEEVAGLPFKGNIREAFTDPRQPGITIALQSFVVPPMTFAYDPAKNTFVDLKLGAASRSDPSRFEITDLEAQAKDGVMVPNTLVRPKNAKGPQIVLIQAYGAYGISQLANFSPRAASFLEAGGTYASCHVRGGGELGDAWRLAGKDANKPNSWRDLIACADDLIARGYTTKDKLFIFGGSAGGITMGRALTERPDLFAGVITIVPGANTLRQEFQPNGPLNIPEFGTITTEQGFKNLYAMDTLQHVRAVVQYPPVLITTGLNDPRVSPWEPAKLAAALQASGTSNPILLRIDAEAGHGIGSTKLQDDALYSDMWAFVFWRAGLPEWQPRFPEK